MTAVDDVLRRYLQRMPGAADANTMDAGYHAHLALLRRMLTVADMVMEDEGVDEHVRLRVVRTVMYGSPDEDAAVRHQEKLATLIAAADRWWAEDAQNRDSRIMNSGGS